MLFKAITWFIWYKTAFVLLCLYFILPMDREKWLFFWVFPHPVFSRLYMPLKLFGKKKKKDTGASRIPWGISSSSSWSCGIQSICYQYTDAKIKSEKNCSGFSKFWIISRYKFSPTTWNKEFGPSHHHKNILKMSSLVMDMDLLYYDGCGTGCPFCKTWTLCSRLRWEFSFCNDFLGIMNIWHN